MYNLISRLKEPSTYAGLAALAIAFGMTNGEFMTWAAGAAGFFAFVSVFVKDPGSDS